MEALAVPLEKLRHAVRITDLEWNGAPDAAYQAFVEIMHTAPMSSLPDFSSRSSSLRLAPPQPDLGRFSTSNTATQPWTRQTTASGLSSPPAHCMNLSATTSKQNENS